MLQYSQKNFSAGVFVLIENASEPQTICLLKEYELKLSLQFQISNLNKSSKKARTDLCTT